MALEVRDASCVYDSGTGFARRALSGVSLSLSKGELLLVMGPSGSGKSTLLRACAGLIALEQGEVLVDGLPLTPSSLGAARGLVGLVFQSPETQLFGESVMADVSFGPVNLGRSPTEAADDARAALAAAGLDAEDYGSRSPFGLSGGEARRVAIAGILAMGSPYLLMDEPTAGLDASGRAAILGMIERAREGAGVMIVTHEPEELLALADRVLVLDEGFMTYSGSVGEVMDDPFGAETAGLPIPPVLRLQMLAFEAGRDVGHYSLDPGAVARSLASAGGRQP